MTRGATRREPALVKIVKPGTLHLGLAAQAPPVATLCGLVLPGAPVLPFHDEPEGSWCPRCLVLRRERAQWTCDA